MNGGTPCFQLKSDINCRVVESFNAVLTFVAWYTHNVINLVSVGEINRISFEIASFYFKEIMDCRL